MLCDTKAGGRNSWPSYSFFSWRKGMHLPSKHETVQKTDLKPERLVPIASQNRRTTQIRRFKIS